MSWLPRFLPVSRSRLHERELKWFLNIAVARNRAGRTITLSQQRYVTNALARFEMANCKPAVTPANADPLLPATQETSISDLPMREAAGALLWPARITRPDILNAVLRVARFTSAPTQQAWQAVKRIFRYLKGTSHYALELGQVRNQGVYLDNLVGYADADFAGDLLQRKSTTGNLILLCGSPVSWRCELQRCVSTSTAEAELVSACAAAKELVWLRALLQDMSVGWVGKPLPTVLTKTTLPLLAWSNTLAETRDALSTSTSITITCVSKLLQELWISFTAPQKTCWPTS
jgi:hypothetical protein